MMVQSIFNHIHGKIGSRWAKFIKETGIDHMLIVGIDAAKFTHKAVVSNFMGMCWFNHKQGHGDRGHGDRFIVPVWTETRNTEPVSAFLLMFKSISRIHINKHKNNDTYKQDKANGQ